jgi:hypothetical protein
MNRDTYWTDTGRETHERIEHLQFHLKACVILIVLLLVCLAGTVMSLARVGHSGPCQGERVAPVFQGTK